MWTTQLSKRFARFTAPAAVALAALALSVTGADAAPLKTLSLKGQFKFISDAPLEKIQGTAAGARATITVDLADLTKASGKVSVKVTSMVTGSPIRDEHLQGESWLDGANHPKLTFVIKEVVVDKKEEGEIFVASGTVKGDFTLRGITKPVSSAFTLKVKGEKAKVDLSFEIALADFEIKGREGIIGKKVGASIVITGRLAGKAEDAQ